MARRRRLAKLLTYCMLEVGALVGVPIKLDEIERLTRLWNATVVECVAPGGENGDPPDPGRPRGG